MKDFLRFFVFWEIFVVISNLNKDLWGRLLMRIWDSDTLAYYFWDEYVTIVRKLTIYGMQQYSWPLMMISRCFWIEIYLTQFWYPFHLYKISLFSYPLSFSGCSYISLEPLLYLGQYFTVSKTASQRFALPFFCFQTCYSLTITPQTYPYSATYW